MRHTPRVPPSLDRCSSRSFPNYIECYSLSTQFLLGSGLMVSPVLEQGATSVKALFPQGSWYSIFNMTQVVLSIQGKYVTLSATLNVINVHLYQNHIIPMQQGGLTAKEARMTPYHLVVTFLAGTTSQGTAKGSLFVDEDEIPEMKLGGGSTATYVDFYANVDGKTVKVWSEVQEGGSALKKGWAIEKVIVLGLGSSASALAIEVDGIAEIGSSSVDIRTTEQEFSEDSEIDGGAIKSMMVEINGLNLPIGKTFLVSWKIGV